MSYKSDIKLGERYRDSNTDFEGVAINVTFFQFGCERVTLKGMNNQGEIVEYGFDAPEVIHIGSGRRPVVEKTGGPHGLEGISRRQEVGRGGGMRVRP